MKIAVGLLALILSLAACSSDSEDTEASASNETSTTEASASNETSTTEASASNETSTTEASTSEGEGSEATSDGDDQSSDTSTDADAQPGGDDTLLISAFVAQAGVEPSEELLVCIQDHGADPAVSSATGGLALRKTLLGLLACAPDDLATAVAAPIVPPDGLTEDAVQCVYAETFRQLATVPPETAVVALEARDIPQEVRDEIGPNLEASCGVSEEQAVAIFAS